MKYLDKSILFTVFFLLCFVSFAQPPGPPATPIDGGLGLLLAGGVAYGLKKLKDARKSS